MSTYRALQGYRVKKIAGDPANPNEGQIWYNSSAKTIKIQPLIAAWASAAALQAAVRGNRMTGTQTAGLSALGGIIGGVTAQSQEYNGTSWASNVNANTARGYMAAFGSQAASSFAGGYNSTGLANTETYDGSSFSNGTALNTARWYCAGAGTNTAPTFGAAPAPYYPAKSPGPTNAYFAGGGGGAGTGNCGAAGGTGGGGSGKNGPPGTNVHSSHRNPLPIGWRRYCRLHYLWASFII